MYPRRHVSAMLLRRLSNINPTKRNFSWAEVGKFRSSRCQFVSWDQCVRVLTGICTRQFEFVIAQRLRRTVQIFHLYTRIWNEAALKEFIRAWNRRIWFNRRQIFVSSVFVTSYNWDKERISDQEMYSYCHAIDKINKLRNSTIICPQCQLRLVIDVIQPDVIYCNCEKECKPTNCLEEEWEPFLERQDMLVWRRIEPNMGGLYSYKVYGSFDDVSAEDFLQVQIDVNYRKEWDNTAKDLTILETDPTNNDKVNGNSDIIYWEMIWPTLFANRDYVYQRRWIQDKEKGVIIIINKVTEHQNAPIRPDTHRVSSYWSYMVIKPYREFDEAGIEFSLTYFDDPGISIPSAITSWVAMRGFPDYLCKMREATKYYKTYKASKEETTIMPKSLNLKDNNDAKQSVLTQNDIGISAACNLNDDISENDNINENITEEYESTEDEISERKFDEDSSLDETEKDNRESSDGIPDENQGFLSYFFITRLFA